MGNNGRPICDFLQICPNENLSKVLNYYGIFQFSGRWILKNAVCPLYDVPLDRQNQRISLCALQKMASHFSQSEAVARMGIAHDITLLPVGKVLHGELVDLGHGIIGLEVQIDDFMEEFQQIHGPDNESLYYGRSLQDSRPFVEICSDSGGEFTVSLNPIDFTDTDFEEIVRFVSESENGQIETLAKKHLNLKSKL